MADINEIRDALVAIDTDRLLGLVRSGIDAGLPAKEILNHGLIAAMDIVGEKMEKGDMFIPEVLMCARAMHDAVAILKPLLSVADSGSAGKVLIGTVKGDLHDIGKKLVIMMLESGGYEVIDLGIDVSPEAFVAAIREHNPRILGLSALLTTTMPMMKEIVDAVVESGLRADVKIMVGGAPISKDYADRIGADGYAPDAGAAVKLARSLLANQAEAETARPAAG